MAGTASMQVTMDKGFNLRLKRIRLSLEEKTGEKMNLQKTLLFLAEQGANVVEKDLETK